MSQTIIVKQSPAIAALLCPVLALVLLFWLAACSGLSSNDPVGNDGVLARVYQQTLRLSDMEGMIPEGMSAEDSSLIIQAFVQNWVREAVLLQEAERHIPKDLNIDKLVSDYRASLLRNSYENRLVTELLDSVITPEELQAFYEANKEQYRLETPIVQCRFIKVKRNAPGLDQATAWWSSHNERGINNLRRWCSRNAEIYRLQDEAWYKVEEIAAFMPRGYLSVDNVNTRRDFIQRDDEYQYFFKVLKLVSRPETAPLSYIEEQARKVIQHRRKLQLIEKVRNDIYEEALRNRQVEIYYGK